MSREELIRKAEECWENKAYDDSEAYFKKALKIFLDKDTLLDYALMLSEKDPSLGKTAFQKMIDLYPDFASGYYGIATLYDDEKAYDKALFYYEEGLLYDDKYEAIHCNMASIYEELKDYAKAEYHYLECLKINDRFFDAYIGLGHLYEEKNRDLLALEYFNKAKEIFDCSSVNFNIGVIYKKEKAYDKALFYYKKALDFKEIYPYTYLNLAVLYKDIYKDYDKALSVYSEGIRLFERMPVLYYNRACLYSITGKRLEAQRDLEKAISLDKNFEDYALKDTELEGIHPQQN